MRGKTGIAASRVQEGGGYATLETALSVQMSTVQIDFKGCVTRPHVYEFDPEVLEERVVDPSRCIGEPRGVHIDTLMLFPLITLSHRFMSLTM